MVRPWASAIATQGLRSAECSQPQPRSSAKPDAPSVQARPPSRVARFHDQAGHAGIMQPPSGPNAGRAAADDDDLVVSACQFAAHHGRAFCAVARVMASVAAWQDETVSARDCPVVGSSSSTSTHWAWWLQCSICSSFANCACAMRQASSGVSACGTRTTRCTALTGWPSELSSVFTNLTRYAGKRRLPSRVSRDVRAGRLSTARSCALTGTRSRPCSRTSGRSWQPGRSR